MLAHRRSISLATIRKGLVSLCHVIAWAPAGVVILRDLKPSDPRTPYGIWVRAILLVIGVSMIFDVRDTAAYLYFAASSHPALTGG